MNAKKCDRCGKFYLPTEYTEDTYDRFFVTRKIKCEGSIKTIHYDICEACNEDMFGFMAERGENE